MAGKAIIFSAPSGSGKTTLVHHLLEINSNLAFSVSATTREKRSDQEQEGKDYFFLSPGEFKKKIEQNEFIEWEEVYNGMLYGTLKAEVERVWKDGKNVIFDVDVKGGLRLKKYFGERSLSVFVAVPSLEILKQRLGKRGTENEENLLKRIKKAEFEMSFRDQFDVVLVNDDREKAFQEAQQHYIRFSRIAE